MRAMRTRALLLLAAMSYAAGSTRMPGSSNQRAITFIPTCFFKSHSPVCGRKCRVEQAPVVSMRVDEGNEEARERLASERGEPVASYTKSGGGVKALVSGLTALVNSVMRRDGEVATDRPERASISVKDLCDGIEGDYRRNYLWTGDIDPDLYDWDCLFTDPTLSFKGLDTFQKNLANLRPIIDSLVRDYRVDLYSCNLLQEQSRVVATWRMYGKLALPWSPVIDLNGSTSFTYAAEKGNRIVDYFETWETPAGTVLLNLLRPGKDEQNLNVTALIMIKGTSRAIFEGSRSLPLGRCASMQACMHESQNVLPWPDDAEMKRRRAIFESLKKAQEQEEARRMSLYESLLRETQRVQQLKRQQARLDAAKREENWIDEAPGAGHYTTHIWPASDEIPWWIAKHTQTHTQTQRKGWNRSLGEMSPGKSRHHRPVWPAPDEKIDWGGMGVSNGADQAQPPSHNDANKYKYDDT